MLTDDPQHPQPMAAPFLESTSTGPVPPPRWPIRSRTLGPRRQLFRDLGDRLFYLSGLSSSVLELLARRTLTWLGAMPSILSPNGISKAPACSGMLFAPS